mmetsp:Transcript_61771/g.112473  ORF Transcript_61771/g.112473 Transcript_61771/m.112473 type:complete len:202 (-) Transcript_61771:101-706(-)
MRPSSSLGTLAVVPAAVRLAELSSLRRLVPRLAPLSAEESAESWASAAPSRMSTTVASEVSLAMPSWLAEASLSLSAAATFEGDDELDDGATKGVPVSLPSSEAAPSVNRPASESLSQVEDVADPPEPALVGCLASAALGSWGPGTSARRPRLLVTAPTAHLSGSSSCCASDVASGRRGSGVPLGLSSSVKPCDRICVYRA